ncbi:hypothetical protein [uncultured Fibrobacter sp.]|uniref:hypothetical protein n=1 Tax=uncultured Fibrobacter sp. TaxID=261512 RepID=UPI0025D6393F|nr:hypothetical protein [uncultured Fibrobacter sp.]
MSTEEYIVFGITIILAVGTAVWGILTLMSHTTELKNDIKCRNKANDIAIETNKLKKDEIHHNSRIQYIKYVLPLQKECINMLEALIALPIRNDPDYLNLRLKPTGTIEFDEHQPLVSEKKDAPKNNALYFTLYDKIRMMQPEIEYLFPDAKAECSCFMDSLNELNKNAWALKSKNHQLRNASDEPAAWEKATTAYIQLQQKMIQVIEKSINEASYSTSVS